MTDAEFRAMVANALSRGMRPSCLAAKMSCSITTVNSWLAGETTPVTTGKLLVEKIIKEYFEGVE